MIPKSIQRKIKQKISSQTHNFWVSCSPGFEDILAFEIANLGLTVLLVESGGVEFSSRIEGMWKYHLWGRCGHKVWWRLGDFRAIHRLRLRKKMEQIPWELHLNLQSPIFVEAKCKKSKLYHEGLVCDEVKIAITHRLKDFALPEPVFVEKNLDFVAQGIRVRFDEDHCWVNLDCTGKNLYFRGYNKKTGPAPLRDTYAASMITAVQKELLDLKITKDLAFVDPMTGSGTLSLEALSLNRISPRNDFIFKLHPSFRDPAWQYLRGEMGSKKSQISFDEYTLADRSQKAIHMCEENLEAYQVDRERSKLKVFCEDIFGANIHFNSEKETIIFVNPPYGERLDARIGFYRKLGRQLGRYFSGAWLAIIVPGLESEQALEFEIIRKYPFNNGGLSVALLIAKIA